jgi:hypothetical protein
LFERRYWFFPVQPTCSLLSVKGGTSRHAAGIREIFLSVQKSGCWAPLDAGGLKLKCTENAGVGSSILPLATRHPRPREGGDFFVPSTLLEAGLSPAHRATEPPKSQLSSMSELGYTASAARAHRGKTGVSRAFRKRRALRFARPLPPRTQGR